MLRLVSYGDENEYGNDYGNEIEDCPNMFGVNLQTFSQCAYSVGYIV